MQQRLDVTAGNCARKAEGESRIYQVKAQEKPPIVTNAKFEPVPGPEKSRLHFRFRQSGIEMACRVREGRGDDILRPGEDKIGIDVSTVAAGPRLWDRNRNEMISKS